MYLTDPAAASFDQLITPKSLQRLVRAPAGQPCMHSLVALSALPWVLFLTTGRLDLLCVGFYGEVFYDSVVLWPTADDKVPSPQVCAMKRLGRRSGVVTGEQCQLFAVWALSIITSQREKYSAVRNAKLSIPHWDETKGVRQLLSSMRAKRGSATSTWEQSATCRYLTCCQQCALHWEGKKRARKIYQACLSWWLCLKERIAFHDA